MSAIRVVGLWKGYGGPPVLRGLDLTVAWGEFLVIFGANGAGKTTLLKVLSTLARPDSGEVWIAGFERRREAQAIRRSIGVVAHRGFLYDDLTAYENLAFYGRMFGVSNVRERVRQVAARLGMERRLDQRVRTLSHGMQKRISLAAAILHDPPILLLDEPEAGLDQEALGMLSDVLQGWKGEGRAVLMTTHNLEQGLALGDRVAILAQGKIAYQEERTALDLAGFRGTYQRYLEATS